MNQTRGQIKTLTGTVVSNKMEKTIVVNVTRKYKHPKYGKYINVNKKYYAHDENNSSKMGDLVKIRECKPLSKSKRWYFIEIIK